MDWAEELAKMFGDAANRVGELVPAFTRDAEDFDNVLIKRGGPMLRPRLRSTPEEAAEFDMSTDHGRFLLQREAMFEDALEGM